MILQIVLGHESHLANLTGKRFLALVLDADMLVDTCLVKGLQAQRAFRIQRGFLVLRHKVGLVLSSNMPGQTCRMDKDLTTMLAFFRNSFVHLFIVPVQFSLCLEHLAAMAVQFFGWLDRPILIVNPFVLRQI